MKPTRVQNCKIAICVYQCENLYIINVYYTCFATVCNQFDWVPLNCNAAGCLVFKR